MRFVHTPRKKPGIENPRARIAEILQNVEGRGPAVLIIISLEENRLTVAKVLSSFPRNELSEKI